MLRLTQKIWSFIMKRMEVKVRINDIWTTSKRKDLLISCPKFFYMEDDEFNKQFR